MKCYQITSNYFCAGLIFNDARTVIKAAPILRFSVGMKYVDFCFHCMQKRWKMVEV